MVNRPNSALGSNHVCLGALSRSGPDESGESMRHLKTLLTVLGAVTILVLAGNTVALATTGHAFILGKANSANKQTQLTRTTSGPALKVTTKSTANPPFAVNGHGKVAHLNADS